MAESKTRDFDVWIAQCEEAVNRGTNPHSRSRHERYCLQWLPSYLDADAFVILKRCKNQKNWTRLKEELRLEFEDPTLRAEWENNPVAYKWDENKESLPTYCSKIKRYVDSGHLPVWSQKGPRTPP